MSRAFKLLGRPECLLREDGDGGWTCAARHGGDRAGRLGYGRRLYVADYSGSVTVASIASPIVQAADEDITAGLPQLLMLEPALT